MRIIFLGVILALVSINQQTPEALPPSPVQKTSRYPRTQAEVSQLRKNAEAGDAEAENMLGVMYSMGEGVDRDKAEAVRWYHKAAKHGNSAAMFNLGAAYYNGDGVGVDDVASCAWFLLAQEAGYSQADDAVRRASLESANAPIQAAQKIGQMYEGGEELPKDPTKALKWYREAGDGGVPEADVRVAGLLLAKGANPTPEAYAEARKRCEDAANLHNAQGTYCMALIYQRGLGVSKDPVEAAKWLSRAADLGHPKAVLQLGEAYWKGDGVKPDLATAYMWIWMAYRSKVPGAEKDEEGLRSEMRTKDMEKAKKKADLWVIQHHFLVLRQTPADSPSSNQ
jgi:uncharacterized protein